MKARRWLTLLAAVAALTPIGWTYLNRISVGVDMTRAANQFLATLDDSQRDTALLGYDSAKRTHWRFIPVADGPDGREGLQIKSMSEKQREAAHSLLRSCLSDVGYGKATKIMELEHILHVLEGGQGRFKRETERYFFTVFGQPDENGRWGLGIEGHHLSLNFVVDGGKVISSTPTFLAANPALVKNKVEGGQPVGTQVLKSEEELAFQLLNSFNDEQKKKAVIAEKAFQEIRGPADAQPPKEELKGLSVGEMNDGQRRTVRALVTAYADNLPDEIREGRMNDIRAAGPEQVHFAWAGAAKPGIGHYYRIQGPTFLIEFVNTQPDAAGNPANHIHCVWRDMRGDFAMPLE